MLVDAEVLRRRRAAAGSREERRAATTGAKRAPVLRGRDRARASARQVLARRSSPCAARSRSPGSARRAAHERVAVDLRDDRRRGDRAVARVAVRRAGSAGSAIVGNRARVDQHVVGRTARPVTARRIASRLARSMFRRSTSSSGTSATQTASACARIARVEPLALRRA